MMKDKGDIGFMFKQGQIRLVPSMGSKNGSININVM